MVTRTRNGTDSFVSLRVRLLIIAEVPDSLSLPEGGSFEQPSSVEQAKRSLTERL
jgi:hypothetical protein